MRDLRRLLQSKAVVTSSALALALGSLGLVGCGGSAGEAGGDAPAAADAGDAAEESEEEAKHWVIDRQIDRQTYQSEYWDGTENVTSTTNSKTVTRYRRDEHGNVTRSTVTRTDDWGDGTAETKTVSRFERDEQGWPTQKKSTVTTVYTNDDGSEQADEPETTETTYTYEHDDEGRVLKVTSSDASEGFVEFTYGDDGNVASYKMSYDSEYYNGGDEPEIWTYAYEIELNEDGKATHYRNETVTPSETTVTDTELDGEGVITKETQTKTPNEGEAGSNVWTYENEKDKDGNVTKQTVTVSGDGAAKSERWANMGKQHLVETFGEDGTITVTEMTRNDNGEEVAGEAKTYDGPYSVTESTYDDKGNCLTSTTTYYDGSVTKDENTYNADGLMTSSKHTNEDGSVNERTSEYDENGILIKATNKSDTNSYRQSYRHVYVEDPSDFLMNFQQYVWWLQ